jgi:uroporphyrinogen decarboxylase
MALFAEPVQIREQVATILARFGEVGPGSGHIFNLGHGISQHTPPEHVVALVEAVHELSPAWHRASASSG